MIVILADDLGYGDLGCYGATAIRTPNLDRMAREGVRMTNFYASANVCTPSRAGLMTGRYPIRTGLAHQVILPGDRHGLPPSERTVAELLKPDYATSLVGKWHLGHVSPHWPPTAHGFDEFFGLPYSNDMKPLSLFTARGDAALTTEPVDQSRLTERFFDRAARFIERNAGRPFLLVLAPTAPHIPIVPNPSHRGSRAGAYGDVVEELDAQVGRLHATLRRLGIDERTLSVFTSDNGPWFEGSSGPLRDRKGGGGFEGGHRVPLIARLPGVIPAERVSDAIAMNIDLPPTMLALAGKRPPADLLLDGRDLGAVWRGAAAGPHDALILFDDARVAGVRTRRWKLVTRSYYRAHASATQDWNYWLLFDLEADPGERYNVADRHPHVLAAMQARYRRAVAALEPLGGRS